MPATQPPETAPPHGLRSPLRRLRASAPAPPASTLGPFRSRPAPGQAASARAMPGQCVAGQRSPIPRHPPSPCCNPPPTAALPLPSAAPLAATVPFPSTSRRSTRPVARSSPSWRSCLPTSVRGREGAPGSWRPRATCQQRCQSPSTLEPAWPSAAAPIQLLPQGISFFRDFFSLHTTPPPAPPARWPAISARAPPPAQPAPVPA